MLNSHNQWLPAVYVPPNWCDSTLNRLLRKPTIRMMLHCDIAYLDISRFLFICHHSSVIRPNLDSFVNSTLFHLATLFSSKFKTRSAVSCSQHRICSWPVWPQFVSSTFIECYLGWFGPYVPLNTNVEGVNLLQISASTCLQHQKTILE